MRARVQLQVERDSPALSFVCPGSVFCSLPLCLLFGCRCVLLLQHAQLWLLSSSVLIWIGDRSCTLQSLSCAMPSPWDPTPSVSCLLGRGGGGSGGDENESSGAGGQGGSERDEVSLGLSARLAKVFGVPVFVGLNVSPAVLEGGAGGAGAGIAGLVPGGAAAGPELYVYIERAIIKELKTCQKLGMMDKPTTARLQQ